MKKLFSLLTLILISCVYTLSLAQHDCGQEQYMTHLKQNQNEVYKHYVDNYSRVSNEFRLKSKGTVVDTVFRIPVFFNILSRSGRTVNFEKLDTMLAVLNRGFNRGDDTTIVRDMFADNIADIKIEFYRAILDINGDTIRRLRAKNSFYLYEPNDQMKYDETGLSAYHPEKYLNIWVCNMKTVVGYATPPVYAANWPESYYKPLHLQGIVLDFTAIVPEYSNNFSARSKTIVHEAGHYLGLRHTWGDGSIVISGDSSECWRDDGIKDTPFTISANWACDDTKNTCIEREGIDYPDQYENYMDYSDHKCAVMFTNEQKALMIYNLVNLRPNIYDTAYAYTETPEEISPHVNKTIKVYPNPCNNDLHFDITNKYVGKNLNLTIYSTEGKTVYLENFKGKLRKSVFLLGISSGFYTVQIMDGDEVIFRGKITVIKD